jgi:ribA/ribD-fused uncharacterized protein
MTEHSKFFNPSTQGDAPCVFFYGHKKEKHGEKACFSNFYPAHFTDKDNTSFLFSEQYMMWKKAVLFDDMSTAALILQATAPRDAKALGRQVMHFDQAVWEKHAIDIVTEANHLKFTQNPELKRILLATGSSVLVEASPTDKIWGIGLSAADARDTPPAEWPGTNWLGECLMRVRDRIQRAEGTAAVAATSESKAILTASSAESPSCSPVHTPPCFFSPQCQCRAGAGLCKLGRRAQKPGYCANEHR